MCAVVLEMRRMKRMLKGCCGELVKAVETEPPPTASAG